MCFFHWTVLFCVFCFCVFLCFLWMVLHSNNYTKILYKNTPFTVLRCGVRLRKNNFVYTLFEPASLHNLVFGFIRNKKKAQKNSWPFFVAVILYISVDQSTNQPFNQLIKESLWALCALGSDVGGHVKVVLLSASPCRWAVVADDPKELIIERRCRRCGVASNSWALQNKLINQLIN